MPGEAREWRRGGKGNKYGRRLKIMLPFSTRKDVERARPRGHSGKSNKYGERLEILLPFSARKDVEPGARVETRGKGNKYDGRLEILLPFNIPAKRRLGAECLCRKKRQQTHPTFEWFVAFSPQLLIRRLCGLRCDTSDFGLRHTSILSCL